MAVTAPDPTKIPDIGLSHRLYLISGTKALPMESESSASMANAPVEVSNKDTGNWRTIIDGVKSVDLSASCDYVATNSDIKDLIDKLLSNDSTVEFYWGDITTAGATYFHGFAKIPSSEISAPNGGVCTFSISLQSTGEVEALVGPKS